MLNYSHPLWGSSVIVFAWLPAVTCIPDLILKWRFSNEPDIRKIHWTKKVCVIIFMVVFWPVVGLVL